ncbi:sarcosine oxidase subunit alpha [Oceanisphaera litoralis]|uniref:sarcosine oxidase subunit alpha family protein n=1 Tax=Oceanisphaera litoralis TaxID=225144 RepID=UPI00195A36F0|nr:sarcosine oxidase subunit alpha family protein [Oceanisphaera litoralis]MBM7457221.1 sarcosine oxidase subunit alpha [Oceanisphaera litoralis]
MSQQYRLQGKGRVDHSKPLNFIFNGKTYQGLSGDTIASALLANGVDVVGRSFKYSRPRGIMAAGAEEPNCILQVGSSEATMIPNIRGTQGELYDGLTAASTNGWPNVDKDIMGVMGKLGGSMMPPGFYYKTFMYPQSMWPKYEHLIRKAAGLGRVPKEKDPDTYDKLNHHCDVLVVGGGAAGLAAALAAGRRGARVILVDEQNEFGGHLLHSTQPINGQAPTQWVADAVKELQGLPDVTLLPRSTAAGYYDQNFLTVLERRTDHQGERVSGKTRQRLHRIRAKRVVLATGAHERPLVFGNNDLPGCLVASALSTYVNRYGVAPGNNLVLMTCNDYGYQAALDWLDAGRKISAVVDSRHRPSGARYQALKARGVKMYTGHGLIEAVGKKRVTGAKVAALSSDGSQVTGAVETLSCDIIASSGGWSPVVHLTAHTGSRPVWSDELNGFVPGESVQKQLLAGGIQGTYALSRVLAEGLTAGRAAADATGYGDISAQVKDAALKTEDPQEDAAQALFLVPHNKPVSRAPKQFVDYQNDVTAAGIELAVREGFESIEHIKRYTAMGFGTDQGKLGNINGMAIAARAMGKTIAETGTTVFRPNYTPVTFGAFAGRNAHHLFDPARFTAMHAWHVKSGAEFEDVGQWKRPWFFPKNGEDMHQAVNRECQAVRNSVGILDASTLGKIDIQGADAREFLARIYTNAWAKLSPGNCRYGLMCKEDGMVFDDGVTACINDNHFVMTTTTGGAAGVLQWLELWHQTEWPELEVYFSSVTDHWSTMTVTGPNSRKVLEKICEDVDLSAEAFPFMGWRDATVAGVKARIFRISFTGELSFEINVQANYGLHTWEAVMEAGAEFNITPYGTETMHVLRAEKGFIIVGQDTDGSVTPFDLGMDWCVGKTKPFPFIGQRSWSRSDTARTDRKQLVGLKCKEPKTVIPEGAQIVLDPNHPVPVPMVGHVSSSYYSANLGHNIAMGVVKGGLSRMGETVYCPLADGRVLEAEITSPIFYDPKGERQHV